MTRLEIKGKENAMEVAMILLASGYSVHMPYVEQTYIDKENTYIIIECSLTKYEAPEFVLEEEE